MVALATLCRMPVPAPARATTSVRPQQRLRQFVRRGIPFGAGEVNDPEKVAERKEEKKAEYWGEPKNKNKLEKTTMAHDPELSEAVEKAGEGVEGFVKELGDKLKDITGQK